MCFSSEAAVGVQEDRRKVPWSDKETVILLEIWGDSQVADNIIMNIVTPFNFPGNQAELPSHFTSSIPSLELLGKNHKYEQQYKSLTLILSFDHVGCFFLPVQNLLSVSSSGELQEHKYLHSYSSLVWDDKGNNMFLKNEREMSPIPKWRLRVHDVLISVILFEYCHLY